MRRMNLNESNALNFNSRTIEVSNYDKKRDLTNSQEKKRISATIIAQQKSITKLFCIRLSKNAKSVI